MKKAIAILVAMMLSFSMTGYAQDSSSKTINGAGATFPYPVYSQWAFEYNANTGVQLNYQSIGSGGGIKQIQAKTVDFGASDAPLEAAELDSFGLIQFPMVMGGVVLIVNLDGFKSGDIKLDANLLSKIYLGEITKWNDPALKGVSEKALPNQDITVVYRADGSGTTWIYTNYLMKVSQTWADKVGFGKAVEWPVGVGGKGNEGVAANVANIKGSIGYVEYAYALQNNLTYTQLKNKEGKFVSPTIETFQAACANADWENAPAYYMVLTDQPGDNSWPITGASFILIYKNQTDCNRADMMLKFFDWCYRFGIETAAKLHYVPVPENVLKMVETTWQTNVRCNNQQVWAVPFGPVK